MVLKLHNYEESYTRQLRVSRGLHHFFPGHNSVCCIAVAIGLFCRGRVDSIKKDLYTSYSTCAIIASLFVQIYIYIGSKWNFYPTIAVSFQLLSPCR